MTGSPTKSNTLPTDGMGDKQYSNWQLIKRMLALSWSYRWGCIKLVTLHLLVVILKLGGLGFFGLGVDYVAHHVAPQTYPEPHWPFGLAPPAGMEAVTIVILIAAFVFAAALLQGVLTFGTHVATADLVNRQIVVKLPRWCTTRCSG